MENRHILRNMGIGGACPARMCHIPLPTSTAAMNRMHGPVMNLRSPVCPAGVAAAHSTSTAAAATPPPYTPAPLDLLQVMLAQQQTTAQLLQLLQHATLALAEAVHERGISRAIGDLRSDEGARRLTALGDREVVVQELREAFQQLSPGGVAPSCPNRKTKAVGGIPDARSPQGLRDRINRKLYSVTNGGSTFQIGAYGAIGQSLA